MAIRRKGRGARVFAGAAGVLCWNVAVGQVEPPGSEPQVRTSPQAGIPRPWEAGVSVSPWSVVNLYNGNVLTELTLTQFGPAGPAVRFTLFHNGAAANSGSSTPAPGGFSLGAGWTTSHGGAILDNEDDTVTLLEDDGNQYLFTLEGGSYQPEVGVHDRLVWESGASQWVLTRPDQWRRVFDDEGRLLEVRDAAGRAMTVERDAEAGDRIAALVASEGGGELALEYDPNTGQLSAVTAVDEPNDPTWTFEYDGNDRLWKVHYPGEAETLTLAYNGDNRIVTITDASEATWDLRYNAADRVRKAMDPPDPNTEVRDEQLFSYETYPQGGRWRTYYTDRRTMEWAYGFDVDGRFRERSDPNDNVLTLKYDSDWNVTSLDDGQNEVTMTWGPAATLTSVHIPASGGEEYTEWNDVTLVWEQPDPNGAPNFWRRTQMYDSVGNDVQYAYDDANDATRVTELIEQEPNASPVARDGALSAYPATGLGTGWRMYWSHPGADSPAPIERVFLPTDPRPKPVEAPLVTTSIGDWRWRITWVIPGIGAHVGIDYRVSSSNPNTLRYVDYGQPPEPGCQPGCGANCCIPKVKFSNNRYAPTYSGLSASAFARDVWHSGSSGITSCFDSTLPRNWGQCCQYMFLGAWPWSNSNGGAHASILRCISNPPYPNGM